MNTSVVYIHTCSRLSFSQVRISDAKSKKMYEKEIKPKLRPKDPLGS